MASKRQAMPWTTAIIDELREVFGEKLVNEQIRAGMNGQTTFYASENGLTVGTKDLRMGVRVTPHQIVALAPTSQAGKAKAGK